MKTVEINLFKFDELSEDAKQTAIQRFRESQYEDDIWGSERFGSYKAAEKIYDSLSEIEGTIKGPRLYTWIQNNLPDMLYVSDWYVKDKQTGKIKRQYYKPFDGAKCRKSKLFKSFNLDNYPLTGVCYDFDFLQPIIEFIKKPDMYTDNTDLTLPNYERVAQKDFDYQNTDEYIIETIDANEYDFTEDGKIY